MDFEKDAVEILKTVIDNAYDGIIIIDKNAIITMISKSYCEFMGISEENAIGKPVTDVIQNTRMHIVVQTGVTETAQLQSIKGSYMIATRMPIIKNGEIIGAIGKVLFRNVKELNTLYSKIKTMKKELESYKTQLKQLNTASYSFDDIIGSSEKILAAKSIARKAAQTHSNVLILGESGTGKELFAHAIHLASDRLYAPFVKVNCGAIPTDLLESELFGYEGGAFTGAKKEGKIGKFELADGGTIFLDEIGDMPLHMQVKLLRAIQEKEVEKIGSLGSKKIDIRIIAATNINLEKSMHEGKFRQDLYYRLNVVTITIPSLRERRDDILLIANHLITKIAEDLNKKIVGMSKDSEYFLKNYSWEGNIRELENILERAINVIENSNTICPIDLPDEITGRKQIKPIKSLEETIVEAEKQAIMDALKSTNGNKTKAAKKLEIGRTSLYEKIQKYNIPL
ncbi:sigma 54-interacting transcriptional regulator [Clostridium estertheticum]|uniref:Sigma 54-interacting transcriptional regulator n=1 Tax=Clostridium estertheticum TaxID=238834 RepID=A0AA47EIE8_9CLOT|nr:sigma 54-interacting transcriptional regulator [Clostridium estertheticum]MBU3157888.1 sigma 54-interacting transcriptional regulator [Clostridium estertheticum]MBU3202284.1 sigma 54-interacting transcriptional regulator [Clostridium estertheticum]WAG59238.1 sigma 54-interacting transcriptional regulator [Clostridium estertheticum]WAG66708.1 sigma 54-interacting transcriptional regulator [Clostridium estertheticum]